MSGCWGFVERTACDPDGVLASHGACIDVLMLTATANNGLTSAETTADSTATSCGLPGWSPCGLSGNSCGPALTGRGGQSVGPVVVGESGPEPDPLAFVGDASLEGEPGAARPLAGVLPLP